MLIRLAIPVLFLFVIVACNKKDEEAGTSDKAQAAASVKAADSVTCGPLVTKMVDLMKAQGEHAIITAKDIPALTQGCTQGKIIETFKSDAECTLKAADLKGLGACPGANKMLKTIMKNAK